MKKRHGFLVAAVLAGIALVAWLARPSASPSPDLGLTALDPAARGEPDAPVVATATAPVLEAGADAPRTEAVLDRGASTVPAAAVSPDSDAIVVGRVVDEAGVGIAGAELRFGALDTWATGRVVPQRIGSGRRIEEYVTKSGDDGRFRFDVAVPTADPVFLQVEAGPFHSTEYRNFGVANGKTTTRIAAGSNDLGDIVLPVAGVVRGRVLGADGTAIANARVRREGDGNGAEARSAGDGAYELEHAAPGTCSISARADGWMSAKVEGVVVVAGQSIGGVDFALVRASSISGTVVDQDGAPAIGVRIWGWPESAGQGNGAKTDAEGHFTLYLPQHEPYNLEATKNPEFEDWGLGPTESETYPPGTDDVRIVLTRKSSTRFRVVDAASAKPVTTFALAIENRKGGGMIWDRFASMPSPSEHEGGELVVATAVGSQSVGVVASGYAPLEARIEHDVATPGVQTLRLERESVLVARLVQAGAPVAGTTVGIEGYDSNRDRAPFDAHANDAGRATDIARRLRSTVSAPDGSIRFDQLAEGAYTVVIRAAGRTPRSFRGVVLARAETRDLGDLEIAAPGRITGLVRGLQDVSNAGAEVVLQGDLARSAAIDGRSGAFAFEGVELGFHVVELDGAPFGLHANLRRDVVVEAGRDCEVVFDVVAEKPCAVELTLASGPTPQPGLSVRWSGDSSLSESSAKTIESDARGLARGTMPGGRPGAIVVTGRSGLELARLAVADGLPSGGTFRERIEIACGALVVVLPDSVRIPEAGEVQLVLRGPQPLHGTSVLLARTPGDPRARNGNPATWSSRRIEERAVAPGEYDLVVRVEALRQSDLGGMRVFESEAVFESPARRIRVVAGASIEVDLR